MLKRGAMLAALVVGGSLLGAQNRTADAVALWMLAILSAVLVGLLQQTLP